MKYLKLYIYFTVSFTSFTVCSGDIKKQKQKNSENDQSTGNFQSFFSVLPILNLNFFSRLSTNNKILALLTK